MENHHPEHTGSDHIHLPHVPEKDIRIAFTISLALKALGAFVETVLGFLLLFTGAVTGAIVSLIQNEFIEDPNGFFATHFSGIAAHVSAGAQIFGAVYLLSHGIIKIFLLWGLVKNKLWAYPASLAVFGLFILYQVVSVFRSFSIFFVLLTIFDLFVIALIWHEYRYLLKKRHIREG